MCVTEEDVTNRKYSYIGTCASLVYNNTITRMKYVHKPTFCFTSTKIQTSEIFVLIKL